MRCFLARIFSCFIFSREKRRAFRARYCARERSPLERLEEKVDLLTRAVLSEKIAPGALAAICPAFPLADRVREKLCDSLWANLGGNGKIRRQMLALQTELFRELVYVLPSEEVAEGLRALSAIARDEESALVVADALSWVYRRRENYASAAETLAPLFAQGTPFPPALHRRLILCENRRGNAGRAAELTRIYHASFGTRDLWRQCDTAKLSEKCGKSDPEIRAAVALAERARKAISSKFFERFLAGKSIAVVGNGPQEIGSGNGEKIDAHDVVIRFNDFPEDEKFRRDYGAKTDVWLCACWAKTAWRERVPVVIAGDFFYSDEYPDADYVKTAAGTPQSVLAIPADFYRKILSESGIKLPTTGALLLAWIKEIRPDFSAADVFGFSFKETVPPARLEHYYRSESTRRGTIHDLDEERAFLRKLFDLDVKR